MYSHLNAIYNICSHAKVSRPDIQLRAESRATLSLTIRDISDDSSPESLSSALYLAVRSPWLCVISAVPLERSRDQTHNRSRTIIPLTWSILPLMRPSRMSDTTRFSTSLRGMLSVWCELRTTIC